MAEGPNPREPPLGVERAAQASSFTDQAELRAIGLSEERLGPLIRAARESPDPDRAIQALHGLLLARRARGWERVPTEDEFALLARVAASSDPLARVAIGEPQLLRALSGPLALARPGPARGFARALAVRLGRLAPFELPAAQRVLRRARYRELFRAAARELLGHADILQSAGELSALATDLCRAATDYCRRSLSAVHGAAATRFCVLALGKLGGDELNFSSDVDLIFLYEVDGDTAGGPGGRTSHREFFTRLAEQLIRLLGETTADGLCYRVDVNLRPEGRGGPLVNPLGAIRGYYETYGRGWERLALLRAKPLAGDLSLGDELLRALVPFVHRRSADFTLLSEMRGLKERLEREAARHGDDVKRGPGGIREIEFVAQTLALLHSGQRPALRQRSLATLLDRLEGEGILPSRDRDELSSAYRFLRRLEHRLQMLNERQTHLLPEAPAERTLLAQRLGQTTEAFEAELARHRAAARGAFEALLGAGRRTASTAPALSVAADAAAPDEERILALQQSGFDRPDEALAELRRIERPRAPFGPGATLRSGEGAGSPAEAFLPALLGELSRTPDPDRALGHFADWASSLRAPATYLGLLLENPPSLRRLFNLFGGSDLLSRELLRHPELLDLLLPANPQAATKGAARFRDELRERLGGEEDPERLVSLACRYRNEEVLRIGLLDLSGELPVEAVGCQLSDLARALLEELLRIALRDASLRFGDPERGSAVAVVALGSLGGDELSYGSDLDLLFLYASQPGTGETAGGRRGRTSHQEYFVRVAQRLIGLLATPVREGVLYRTDSRLRPSGNQGSLVTSLPAFRAYHASQGGGAALWERQSLLKASFAAGDRALFDAARREVLEPTVYAPLADPAKAALAIDRLRRRMEVELAGEEAGRYNPKLGRGGLVEIEFTVQFLQLVHGHRLPAIRLAGTASALAALAREGLLPAAEEEDLAEAHRFLRKLEGRLRIAHAVREAHLPQPGRALAALARRLGFESQAAGSELGEFLLAEYRRLTSRVRAIHRRVLLGGAA